MADTENKENVGQPVTPVGKSAAKSFEPPSLHLSSSPHIRANVSVPKIMLLVIIALIPAIAASVVFFGLNALVITAVCVVAALLTESVANILLKRPQTIGDLSAIVTGILVAFNVSSTLPLWMAALGSVFAVGIAKMVFGGLGCNFINPALAGRAFLVASYPAPMTHFSPPIMGTVNGLPDGVSLASLSDVTQATTPLAEGVTAATSKAAAADSLIIGVTDTLSSIADTVSSAVSSVTEAVSSATSTAVSSVTEAVSSATSSSGGAFVDAVSAATPLGAIKYAFTHGSFNAIEYSQALPPLFWGNVGGCLGETSALALLVGGIFLIAARVIDIRIPLFYILTVFCLFWLNNGTGSFFTPESFVTPAFHILAGGLFLGAFFMATDPVTSPITPNGRIFFGIGCGVLTFVIRKYGGYPEGVSFSILLMNLVVPIIDRYTRPAIYGEVKRG